MLGQTRGKLISLFLLAAATLLMRFVPRGMSEQFEAGTSPLIPHPTILSYVVDPATTKFRFFSRDENGKPFQNHGNLKRWLAAQDRNLLFAMNGGMYLADLSPQGLYIEDGIKVEDIDRRDKGYGNFYLQPNGVFFLTDTATAFVVSTKQYRENEHHHYATQSGPMLVIDGQIHPAFNEPSKNVHIRNGVGLLPDGRLLLAMSKEKINLYGFAKFFLDNGCQNALYLDGFVSRSYLPSQQWIQEDGKFGIIIAEFE